MRGPAPPASMGAKTGLSCRRKMASARRTIFKGRSWLLRGAVNRPAEIGNIDNSIARNAEIEFLYDRQDKKAA